MVERFIVVTGGPGVGKTALVDALRGRGYGGTEEAARAIIRDQRSIGRPDISAAHPILFGELMLAAEIRSYRMAGDQPGPVFFDRAIPELTGFFRAHGGAVPAYVDAAARAYRYRATVLLAPVWPEIFAQDAERTQTLDHARRVEVEIIASYRAYGYRVVKLPIATVEERVEFVLNLL